ncbi:TlpA family protein disulfide reductase [Compostimonas suwonensis]|uniref:Thiol-disulfide isomerase/thioredoxin n=1 Tax=Compostimonas suwonensis TaxID=1048394 RepID=A0A2M9C3J3_9MICO|nr:TlpA disulfide reductase family protein [Compostimonas suwonensis]PJJ65027.1 thiol-disulfide isomerase/thioredoxin [Compostimonas suwonensis]
MSAAARVRRAGVAVLAAAALIALTGCTSDPLAEQYREGSNKGYIAADGTVTEFDLESRGDPVAFSGTTENGDEVSSADFAGEVLVLNFWYAGCAPCRLEAPDLQELNEKYDGAGASFLGVNVRDQPANATSFNKTYGVTYPSIMDVEKGSVKLAFSSNVPANAVPTTIVLDAEGRVAARILGQVTDPSILDTLIRDTIAEGKR